jgi:glutamate synthase domain-containing protein 1
MDAENIKKMANYIAVTARSMDNMDNFQLQTELTKTQQVVDNLVPEAFSIDIEENSELICRLQDAALRCRDCFLTRLGLRN